MARMRELPWLELQDRVRHVISVPVEVRVNWQTRIEDWHKRMYWQRFQTTLPRYRQGSGALWKLLTRCLPFAECSRCNFSKSLDYDAYVAAVAEHDPNYGGWRDGWTSYEIDTLGEFPEIATAEQEMDGYCFDEQHDIMQEPIDRSNGMPKTLLVILCF
jgi:hypothetical protein